MLKKLGVFLVLVGLLVGFKVGAVETGAISWNIWGNTVTVCGLNVSVYELYSFADWSLKSAAIADIIKINEYWKIQIGGCNMNPVGGLGLDVTAIPWVQTRFALKDFNICWIGYFGYDFNQNKSDFGVGFRIIRFSN